MTNLTNEQYEAIVALLTSFGVEFHEGYERGYKHGNDFDEIIFTIQVPINDEDQALMDEEEEEEE